MTNGEILRRVASDELEPDAAVGEMVRLDQERRAQLRPRWLPIWAWAVCLVAFGAILAACGVSRD